MVTALQSKIAVRSVQLIQVIYSNDQPKGVQQVQTNQFAFAAIL